MADIKYLRLGLFFLLFLASGCALWHTEPKQLVCPPPPQQDCYPAQWNGTPYDTSWDAVKNRDFYYTFSRVKQINSPNDEWSLAFYSYNRAVLTYSDGNRQKVMLVRMVNYDKGTMESGVGVPLEGNAGAFTFGGNGMAFAAEKVNDIIGNSDIYFANLNGNMLEDVVPAGENINKNKYSWESQPSLSEDGNVLFFSSDIGMDTAGDDIYFSVKMPDGSWSEAINCGDMVNSKCDELTPYVTKDGKTLYFSSNGHETVGGYDIFSSEISDKFWADVKQGDIEALKNGNYFSKAENLKPPLNTPADELFPSSPGDYDSLLYYASNQKSGENSMVMMQGGFDIFVRKKVYNPKKIIVEKKKLKEAEVPKVKPTYILEGTVFNAETNEPVPKADVTVKKVPENTIYTETKSNDEGKYKVNLEKNKDYQIVASAQKFFFDAFSMRVDSTDTVTYVTKNVYVPKELTLRVNFPTDEYMNPYRYVLDSNGVESNMTWEASLDILADNIMKSKEFIEKIIFVGNTDDVGTDEYNKQLGQRRVDFIISELEKRGVPAELLEGRSAGERELLPKRPGEDINMWRKRCRRVELQKINKA